jgi:very-short-patch-repair endonuclease
MFDMRTPGQTRRLAGTVGVDRALASLAQGQHGVVARRQLLELGLSAPAIGRRIRLGRLHRVHTGVYAVGHRVLSREGRWMAAVLLCGPDAVLSHRSAAALWGIRGQSSGAIEVTAPIKSRSFGVVRRHFAVLPADEVTIREGIPTTTVPRAIFDLATVLRMDAIEHALRESERLRLYDALSLPLLLDRYPRHRGNSSIRACLRRRREMPPGVTREELEARFRAFIDDQDLPAPRLNSWLTFGSRRYQVDCLWPGERLIVELDGYATHGIRSAFESDRERDRRLAVAGYSNVRVTWRQLHDDPETIADDLRRLLMQYKRM